jgi:four helix bundle protein
VTKITSFTDLEAWKEAHCLTLLIYKKTQTFPKEEVYGVTSQIRRAVISIESCIAEGFCRYHYKDRLNFYYDARGSLGEVHSQAITARDLRFISDEDFQEILHHIEKTGALLGGLIRGTMSLSKK